MNIRPYALVVHFDFHPVGDPLNHVPPRAVIELGTAALAFEKLEFREERSVAFSADSGHAIEEAQWQNLIVQGKFTPPRDALFAGFLAVPAACEVLANKDMRDGLVIEYVADLEPANFFPAGVGLVPDLRCPIGRIMPDPRAGAFDLQAVLACSST
ncbi:MAG: hypothetical protein VX512_12175 [Pseudomonadota bacterium]|nr:hypothetical protein [Pseudomonadota bacterium]